MAKSKKPMAYPNKTCQWSYYMQAIEPNSREINEAFPEYHPMWIIQSQRKTVSAEYFKLMREHTLKMSRNECAAYLRVSVSTVRRWEAGSSAIPFVVFELLRVVSESVNFKLSDKSWQGWFVDHNGRLVSPDRGNLSFSPDELSFIRETHQVKAMYQTENGLLREEVESLRKEISELRVADNDSLLLDELKEIEERLAELTQKVSSKNVVKIGNRNKIQNPEWEEKAA